MLLDIDFLNTSLKNKFFRNSKTRTQKLNDLQTASNQVRFPRDIQQEKKIKNSKKRFSICDKLTFFKTEFY